MKIIFKIISYPLLLCFSLQTFGQTKVTLSYEEFIKTILETHPTFARIENLDLASEAIQQQAKGFLDPLIFSSYEQKNFDEKNYYQKLNASLKVPTKLGAYFEIGYDRNQGQFLNNEGILPSQGLMYGGINVPLLQGLIYNKIRYNEASANIERSNNDLQQIQLKNELLYTAKQLYIQWIYSEKEVVQIEEVMSIKMERFENTKLLFANKNAPAIDTLEAYINIQSTELEKSKAQQKNNKYAELIKLILWPPSSSKKIPFNIKPELSVVENILALSQPIEINELILTNHLDVVFLNNKLEGLAIKQKLLKENLKPKLDVKLRAITQSFGPEGINYSLENYNIGADFKYPILNRTTKGKIKINKLESSEIKIKESEAIQKLLTHYQIIQQNILQTKNQINIQQNTIDNLKTLLNAEKEKFKFGYSSQFLLNAREEAILKESLKLLKLEFELYNLYLKNEYEYSLQIL